MRSSRWIERKGECATVGVRYVPPKEEEEEEEEPIDPRLEKQMEGKMYYEVLEVDRAAGARETSTRGRFEMNEGPHVRGCSG